jgi:hypothetical protein
VKRKSRNLFTPLIQWNLPNEEGTESRDGTDGGHSGKSCTGCLNEEGMKNQFIKITIYCNSL